MAYLDELQPVGVIEAMLTDEVIALSWRLGRAGWIEADTWRSSISAIRASSSDLNERQFSVSAPGVQLHKHAVESPERGQPAFFDRDSENEFLTVKLDRYETRLARRRDKVLKMLFAAQDRRAQARAREDERVHQASETIAVWVSVPARPIDNVRNEPNPGTVDAPAIEAGVTPGEPIIHARRLEASAVATAETIAAPADPIEKVPNEANSLVVESSAIASQAVTAEPSSAAISTEGVDQEQ